MIQGDVYNSALERFAGEVEAIIDSRGLAKYKGTSTLDSVQQEIDTLVNKHNSYISRPDATMVAVARDFKDALVRIELLVNEVASQRRQSNLGSVHVQQVSIMDDPLWVQVLSKAKRGLERFTNVYAAQIATLPTTEKTKLDYELEDILLGVNQAFMMNSSTQSAQAHMAHLDQVFGVLDQRFTAYANFTMEKSLQNLIEKKLAERNTLISQLKIVEDKLTPGEKQVAMNASAEAFRLLNQLKSDSASYNKALRQQKVNVIDVQLANLKRVIESIQFKDNLSGGQFMTPRRPTTKTYGFGDIPGSYLGSYRQGGGRRPFVGAPSHRARGLGNLIPTNTDDPQSKIADALAKNLATAESKGKLSPEEATLLRNQNMQLTVALYQGNHAKLEKAKMENEQRISKLSKEFSSNLGATYIVNPGPKRTIRLAIGGVLATFLLVGTTAYAFGYGTVAKE
jgi:hypothetical protein